MKKLIIKSISLVLILVMSALMMFSCEQIRQKWNMYFGNAPEADQSLPKPGYGFVSMFPDDWTGGFFREEGNDTEFWWVETYDELLVAIEKLKSHGSTFASDAECLVNYDGPLFDVKYCIVIPDGIKGTESISFGEDPFDRYAKKVYIRCWGFLEEVTIEEINYGYVERMESFVIYPCDSFGVLYAKHKDNILELKYYSKPWSSIHRELLSVDFYSEENKENVFCLKTWFDLQLYDEEMIFQTVLSNIGCLYLSDKE